MATKKRVVRRNPAQNDRALRLARERYLLFGVARGQVIGFFDFIRSHGVISLAVGIIVGTAVATLVKSLGDEILNPLIGLVLPSKNLSTATLKIHSASIGWGSFVSNLINFILVALVVYILFKLLHLEKLDKKEDDKK